MQQLFQKILPKITPYLRLAQKYAGFLFTLVLLGVYLYLVQHIGPLIQSEPSQSAVDSKLKPINKLVVDQDSIQKITDLESQNVDVKSLFEQARENPFTE